MNPEKPVIDEEASLINPFPGLRPFREDEEYLFFGRENQIDAMVNKLAANHFLAVIGGSGSGKSSLVNCGLRPALHAGFMASAGTRWKIAQFRPGNDPIGQMARALSEDGILFSDYDADGMTLAEIVDTSLRMSKDGLIDIFQQANLEKDVNVLIVVDQFEELFRYRQLDSDAEENIYGMSTEATAFVNLLLAVKEQTDYPIYVVLTMRTDFLGDCTKFIGLAEAINEGQYLVPRMTRDERRAAISGPVGVGGAEISQILLTRLVNDVGDNPDQLSILQHALNRTWARWQYEGKTSEPIDLPHYEAIGTMERALDQHAEKAYAELKTSRQREICEKIFKVLTDKATDPRGVRRPTIFGALCAMADASEAEVIDVIDIFRKPSRSFLMPPADKPIELDTVVDISHESLMRVWQRLNTWAVAEAKSARLYRRLADSASRHAEGNASLLRDPDLQLALDWREKEKPTAAWADLYQGGFDQAMAYLQKSKDVHDSEVAEADLVGILRIARNVILGFVAASFLIGPLGLPGSRMRSEPYSMSEEFKKSLRGEQLEVVLMDAPEIKTIGNAPEHIETNYTLETDKSKIIESRFRDTQKTPFEFHHVRLALENQALLISQIEFNQTAASQLDRDLSSEQLSPKPSGLLSSKEEKDKKEWKAKVSIALNKLRNAMESAEVVADDGDTTTLGENDDPQANVAVAAGSNKVPSAESNKRILVLPKSFDIISKKDNQVWLVGLLLKSEYLKGKLLRNAENSARVLEASTLLIHLLLYFFLVFGVGYIYRKLEFRDLGNKTVQASTQRPWHIRVYAFMRRANAFLAPVQTRLGKFAVYVVFLLVGVLFCIFWSDLAWPPLLLGLLAILLIPPNTFLNQLWAARAKIAQGTVLQLIGFFSLISGFLLFYRGDYFPFDPLLLLEKNPWIFWNPIVFLIAGGGLVIAGKIKCSLTTEEILLREPGRAPVVYLRSYDNARHKWKEAWAASPIRFFRPKEEQILRSIFSPLGPFVRIERPESEWMDGENTGVGNGLERLHETKLIENSSLVLLQIDGRPTKSFLASIRMVFQTVKPEQILFYFSLRMDVDESNKAYQVFSDAIEGDFPSSLPLSLNENRFISFGADWKVYTFGDVTNPKLLFGKFLPFLGRRLDVIRARRLISRKLKKFFSHRDVVNLSTRLYSDFAVSFAALPLFGLFPSGYMMFINFWRTGRRWAAVISLFAPATVFLVAFLLLEILSLMAFLIFSPDWMVFSIFSASTYFFLIFGFPFFVYWLWTMISGRLIRRQVSFGGSLESWWKNIAVPSAGLMSISGLIGLFILLDYRQNFNDPSEKLIAGQDQAEQGDIDGATRNFAAVLKLNPDLDLVSETERIDQNPRAVALVWYGVSLAKGGKVDEAIAAFKKARALDPEIELDPANILLSENAIRDPRTVASRIASTTSVADGREQLENGNLDEAVESLTKAKKLDPGADLNPETEAVETDPYAVAQVLQGTKLAKTGQREEAIEAFKKAKGIDLDPSTEEADMDPELVVQKWEARPEIEKGRELAQSGDLNGAVAALKRALKLDPNLDLIPKTKNKKDRNAEAVALVWYGVQSAKQGQLSEAIAAFEKAREKDGTIELDPEGATGSGSGKPVEVAQALVSRAKLNQ